MCKCAQPLPSRGLAVIVFAASGSLQEFNKFKKCKLVFQGDLFTTQKTELKFKLLIKVLLICWYLYQNRLHNLSLVFLDGTFSTPIEPNLKDPLVHNSIFKPLQRFDSESSSRITLLRSNNRTVHRELVLACTDRWIFFFSQFDFPTTVVLNSDSWSASQWFVQAENIGLAMNGKMAARGGWWVLGRLGWTYRCSQNIGLCYCKAQ